MSDMDEEAGFEAVAWPTRLKMTQHTEGSVNWVDTKQYTHRDYTVVRTNVLGIDCEQCQRAIASGLGIRDTRPRCQHASQKRNLLSLRLNRKELSLQRARNADKDRSSCDAMLMPESKSR